MDKEIEILIYEVKTVDFQNDDLKNFAEYNMSKKNLNKYSISNAYPVTRQDGSYYVFTVRLWRDKLNLGERY